jgi:hypothetical protein
VGYSPNANAGFRNGLWQEFHAEWCGMILTTSRHLLKTLGQHFGEVHRGFVLFNSFFAALKQMYLYPNQHKQTVEDLTFLMLLRAAVLSWKYM